MPCGIVSKSQMCPNNQPDFSNLELNMFLLRLVCWYDTLHAATSKCHSNNASFHLNKGEEWGTDYGMKESWGIVSL